MDLTTAAVTTLAGGSASFADGVGVAARFNNPNFIAMDASGGALFVADGSNLRIRSVNISTALVTTVAGSGATGVADAVTALQATWTYPNSVLVHPTQPYIFVTDANRVKRVGV